jgi:hypothetical protein
LTASLLAACTGSRPSSPVGPGSPAGPSPSPQSSAEVPVLSQRFEPALYVVPGEGWRAILDIPGSFSLDGGDPPAVKFLRVSAVFDPISQKVARAPRDLEAWILAHPSLESESPVPVSIGGIEGIQINSRVVSAPETPYQIMGAVCPIPGCLGLFVAGSIVDLREGSVVRFMLVEVDGEQLVVQIDALEDEWESFVLRAEDVLDTVRFL